MRDLNNMGMVDPQGRFHSTGGLSHPDWANENRTLVGFVGTKDSEYDRTEGTTAVFDDEGRTALDYFKDEGWIRVKPNNGVELGSLHRGNLELVKEILRAIARDNPGRTLYVDDGDGSKHISVSERGRPDFSALQWYDETSRNRGR